jgi:hypothetical protein
MPDLIIQELRIVLTPIGSKDLAPAIFFIY